jgi:hypothetical protein
MDKKTWVVIAAVALFSYLAGSSLPPVQSLWWAPRDCIVHYMERATTDQQHLSLQHYCTFKYR